MNVHVPQPRQLSESFFQAGLSNSSFVFPAPTADRSSPASGSYFMISRVHSCCAATAVSPPSVSAVSFAVSASPFSVFACQ